ncbi:hypothetical protein Emtol_2372 [Emticicia oligotrophica DSM 17448]|uniref:Uncharacterized protein n=1 Tax=Emticicia oligotrophica (strain DSM 17448 / CIP 109782 / MTCC 6937 / GPTSA100-15) TaxID=929562 RepID=A0ABM5N260_EMTOG|nr:hypothetical protein [Emticicia oligotrophica]AFK03509.1 hypothetical protein Emtol_2372 [Emticicia oligotrophica DSM 17448]
METTTKEDKIIFFVITLAATTSFIFIINYVNPVIGFSGIDIFCVSLIISSIITIGNFGVDKENIERNSTALLCSGGIWLLLAGIKWFDYTSQKNDSFMASIFTFTAIITWWIYFKFRRIKK